MTIYDKLIKYFGDEKKPIVEEKTINFGPALPGVSDGRIYYSIDRRAQAFSTNYVINKCVNILAYNLSRLPFRVYRNDEPLPLDFKLGNGFDILQPHPRMSLAKLLYECAVYYWYKGEFMALIDEDTPFSLEPTDPSRMTIGNSVGRNIESWRYDYSKNIVDSGSLIYVPMMNPDALAQHGLDDSNRTLSLVEVVKREILNYASGREFNTQFFHNFAQLGLTFRDTGESSTYDDRQALAKSFDSQLRKGKAYQTKVLPPGFDVANTHTLSMKEMEFNQSLKDIRDIILGVYGVPRSVFGITNDVGLSQGTVEVEKRLMWTETIKPAAHMIQEAFNQTLMKKYFPGYKVYFDYSDIDVLQDDMSSKLELASQYRKLGYTTQEINKMLDLGMEESSEPALNTRFISTQEMPYDEVSLELPEEDTKSIDNSINKIVDILDREEKTTATQYNYRNRFNRSQRKTEKEMVPKLRGYFSKQLGKVLSLVKSEKTITKVNSTTLLADIMSLLEEEKTILSTILEPIYTSGALRGSTLALNTLKSEATPIASEKVVKALTNEIRMINNHTYRLIRTQIKDSINAGETIAQMSKRVQQVYKFNASRSRTIARTESLKVLSRSSDEEYKKAGVTKKQWLSSPGARETHSACSAQGAIPYDQAFSNGLMYPGDDGPAAEICNCRCCMAVVIEE